MTREAIQRRALQLAAVEAAERQHDRHFDMHGDDAVAEGVDRREQRGPFMAEALRRVPNYRLVKGWADLRELAPPSAWPLGWRVRFLDRLAAGAFPELWAPGEALVDRTPRAAGGPSPRDRHAVWLANDPAPSPWRGRGGYRWLGEPWAPVASIAYRLDRWHWQVGHAPGAVSGTADDLDGALVAAEAAVAAAREAA